jgi:hypothetical protein
MDDIELHRSTAEPTGPETILSPGMAWDVSVIGVFLGIGLAMALFVNNLRRGYASVAAVTTSLRTIFAAAMGVKAAAEATSDGPAPAAAVTTTTTTTMTSTSTSSATYVFSSDPSGRVSP